MRTSAEPLGVHRLLQRGRKPQEHCELYSLICGKILIYEPKLFIIELLCVLSRKRKDALEIVREIRSKIVEVKEEEIFDTAYDLAPVVRGRAADLYYIATARLTGSILISSDQIQVKNAKRANIEAYYTLKETDKLLEKLKQMLSASKPLER